VHVAADQLIRRRSAGRAGKTLRARRSG
jgi:hypothetical protein